MCFSRLFQKSNSRKLWDAVEKQDYRQVKALLDSAEELNINYDYNNLPILHVAVLQNNIPILQLLFSSKYGREINLSNIGVIEKLDVGFSGVLISDISRGNAFAFAKHYKYTEVYDFLKEQYLQRANSSKQKSLEIKAP